MPFFPRYNFLINHSFKLTGRVNNDVQNPNVTAVGYLQLLETPFGTADTVGVETVGFTVGPGGHLVNEFGPIVKNWTWLIAGIWVRNFAQPLARTFLYTV